MEIDTTTLKALTKRVEDLERQNQRFRRTIVLVLLLCSSVFLMAQKKVAPVKAVKALEAGKFLLKDGRGVTRAELGLFADRPALVIYGSKQDPLLSLGAEPEGAGLSLYDDEMDKAATFSTASNGPVVSLFQGGRKRLNLSVTAQGPAVGLLGKNSEAKAAFGLTAEDDSFLQLFGAGERGGTQLLAAPDRNVLRFFDAADRVRAVLGTVNKASEPGLVLNDGAGVSRVILMLTQEGPGLEFFDQDKVRTWIARQQ